MIRRNNENFFFLYAFLHSARWTDSHKTNRETENFTGSTLTWRGGTHLRRRIERQSEAELLHPQLLGAMRQTIGISDGTGSHSVTERQRGEQGDRPGCGCACWPMRGGLAAGTGTECCTITPAHSPSTPQGSHHNQQLSTLRSLS